MTAYLGRRRLLNGSALLGALALSLAVAGGAMAQARTYNIPAEPLSKALTDFARASGRQIIFKEDLVRGRSVPALKGAFTNEAALGRLLEGTGLAAQTSPSGALMIVKVGDAGADGGGREQADLANEVVVTGSRIPRLQFEGPAPVTVINATDIQNNGLATASDIMTSMTQNLGALDNNQKTNGFSPGAQAVDLRGLGPNHTLVLVNGRRIADYPQAYNGNSNFTDISNIPASMIDRVEVLTGAASAVYGSDAISGVVNFILKQKADGTTIDVRAGSTEHTGGASQRVQITSGYSNDKIDSVFGVEFYNADPIWAYQRSFTNSRQDSPAPSSSVYASPVFARIGADGNYIPPDKATCEALSSYDHGSIVYATRPNYGNYCGSYKDVGYGTLENGRQSFNFYGSAKYHLNNSVDVFLDLQAATSHQVSYDTPLQWQNSYQQNGSSIPVDFYNQATSKIEQWQRKYFTIEENGGFKAGEIRMDDATIALNTGVKGSIPGANWSYEALFGFAYNHLTSKEPALIAAKAQALYLGPSLGVDPDSGLQIYNAPISRLYTPLTVAQFRSITKDSVDDDESSAENLTFTLNNTSLFKLPAGPVGFAAVAEYGHQYFGLKPDPQSLDGTYYGLHNTTAVGSRDHYGAGVEFSAPLLSKVTLTAAGRYDDYAYGDTNSGRFTYSAGLEYRPFHALLLRASVGTGFRAPDLSYLYAGLSGSSSGGTDYYLCRKNEPETGPDYADNCSNGDVSYNGQSHGSTKLKDETSKSFTLGFVFSPTRNFDFTADYYSIDLSNEVQYQSSDTVLREEADCRLGATTTGAPMDINSGLCKQVISQVARNPSTAAINPSGITAVLVLPINAADDRTSGLDFSARYRLNTERFGTFEFSGGYTYVLTHKIQLFAGDPVVNELTDLYDYVIPRNKATYSVAWTIGDLTTTLHGQTVGGLPNYDGNRRMGPTSLFNASLNYKVNARLGVSFVVDNLLDTKPGNGDSSWTNYPYYSSSWFSPVGRAFFIELKYRLGGHGGGG
ncbi:MAG: TonB-dependent receptor [Caulobacteraceae bacterium]|nr:TonB-dependent receptor [Caulobacteraceae bacterium]